MWLWSSIDCRSSYLLLPEKKYAMIMRGVEKILVSNVSELGLIVIDRVLWCSDVMFVENG